MNNVFTPEVGWSVWATFDGVAELYFQPVPYSYEEQVRVVYTGKDGHGYFRALDGGESTDWQDLGGNYAHEQAFYEFDGCDNVIYTREYGSVCCKTWSAGEADQDDGYQVINLSKRGAVHLNCSPLL